MFCIQTFVQTYSWMLCRLSLFLVYSNLVSQAPDQCLINVCITKVKMQLHIRIHTSMSEAAVTRSGDLTTTQASRLSYVRAEETKTKSISVFPVRLYFNHRHKNTSQCNACHHYPRPLKLQKSWIPSTRSRSTSAQIIVPSKRRLPMCRMAASSLEISQFSVSVNMRTFMADKMLE